MTGSGYEMGAEIASGGMATVFLGRRVGGGTVALKRIHPHLAKDQSFANMFRDEARLARAIDHPNVVGLFELVADGDDLMLALEYIEGVTLRALFDAARSAKDPVPDGIVSAIGVGLLAGLECAHEATDEAGRPLKIIHRDVSPQNVLLGHDGVPKLTDFGVAKAVERLQTTREGQVKGKLAYMAPEQLISDQPVDRRVDIYSAGAMLYELVTRRRLFGGVREPEMMLKIVTGAVDPPSEICSCDPRWDDVLVRALAVSPEGRFPTAAAMSEVLQRQFAPASEAEVGAWVARLAGPQLARMAAQREAFDRVPAATAAVTSTDGAMAPADEMRPRKEMASRRLIAALGALAVAAAAAAAIGAGREEPLAPLEIALDRAIPDVAPPAASASIAIRHPEDPPAPVPTSSPPAGTPSTSPPRSPPTKTVDCSSPFFTDDTGVRRVRRECL